MIFENKKVFFIFSVVFLLFFSLLACLFSNAFFMADDPDECCMLAFNIKELFLHPYNYNLFSGFFCKLFGFFLPKYMNIHPSDFKSFYFCYIESALLLSTIFVICKLYYQKKKIDYSFVLYFVLSIFLFFLCLSLNNMLIWVYPGLFRMLFPTFFFIILSILLTNIIKNKESSIVEKMSIIVITLLCITSNEMISVVTLLTYLLLTIYSFVKKSFVIEKKFLITALIFSIIGLSCYHLALFRKSEDINIFSFGYLFNLFPLFGKFVLGYLKLIIFNQIIPLLSIIGLSFFLLRKGTEKEENTNIIRFVVISLSSFLIFFLLLFLLGKTHYNGGFWIEHIELMVLFNMVLVSQIFILLRQIIQQKLILKKYFIIFILIFSFALGIYNYIFYSDIYKKMGREKRETYKLEKILRLAASQKRLALLPDTVLKIGYLWCFYEADWKNLKKFKKNIYYRSAFTAFYNTFEEKEIFTEGFLYVPKLEAYEDFQKNGGSFTISEIKNPQFTKLLNEEYIRNEK